MDEFIGIVDAIKILGISREALTVWRKKGYVKTYFRGKVRKPYFSKKEIEELSKPIAI